MKPLSVLLAERAELIKYVIYNCNHSSNIEVLLPPNAHCIDMLDLTEVNVKNILDALQRVGQNGKEIVNLTDCPLLRGTSLSLGCTVNGSVSSSERDNEIIDRRSNQSSKSSSNDIFGIRSDVLVTEPTYQHGGNIFNRGWYEFINRNSSAGLPDFVLGAVSQYTGTLQAEDCNMSPVFRHISPSLTQETNIHDDMKRANSDLDNSAIGVDGSRAVTSSTTDPEGMCVRIRPSAVMTHNFPHAPPKPIWMKLESPNTELFEPLDSNLQLTKLILYDFALLISKLYVPKMSKDIHSPRNDDMKHLGHALSLFRSALRINEKEHRQAVMAFLPMQVLETASDIRSTIDTIVAGEDDLLPSQTRDMIRKLVMPTKAFIVAQIHTNFRLLSNKNKAVVEELQDATSALMLRHNTMMKTRASGLLTESRHLFPLSIRAMIYAGMLSTTCGLVPIDCALNISLNNLSPLLKLAKRELYISDAVVPLCCVHAVIIANKRQMDDDTTIPTDLIDEENSNLTEKGNSEASQVQFMYTLANSVVELQDSSLVYISHHGRSSPRSPAMPNLTEDGIPYRNYVLEICLQFSLLPLAVMLETLNDETLLWSVGDLMFTVCKACCKAGVIKRALLVSQGRLTYYYNNKNKESGSAYHTISNRYNNYYEDHDEVINSILGEILCAPMYRQLVDVATVSHVPKILSSIGEAHRWVLGYAVTLGHSVPEAPALPLEAVIRILSHVLYRRWNHLLNVNIQVPDEFAKVTQGVFEFISVSQSDTIKAVSASSSRLCPPSNWATSSKAAKDHLRRQSSVNQSTYQTFLCEKMAEVTRKAIDESFGWLSPMYDLHMKSMVKNVNKEFKSMLDRVYWDGSGVGVNASVSDIFSLFSTQLNPLLHSFIPLPQSLFVKYLSATLTQLDAYAAKVPGSVNISQWGKLTQLEPQGNDCIVLPPQATSNKFIMVWKFAVAKMEKFGPLVFNIPEGAFIHRLNTLAAVQCEAVKYIRNVDDLYESLMRVTGCESMDVEMEKFNEQVRSVDSVTNRAIDDICESIALLYAVGLKSFFHKIYVTDMKKYKARKQSANIVAENKHLTELYPEVRLRDAIDVLDRRITSLFPNVSEMMYRNKILSYCKLYTVAFLLEVILSDVNGRSGVHNTLGGTTDRFFFPDRSDTLLRDLKEITDYFDNTAVADDFMSIPEVEMLVSSAKYIFGVMMAKETTELVRMYETGMSLGDVVERGDDASCLYIVMCILNHRKDKIAKKFVDKYK